MKGIREKVDVCVVGAGLQGARQHLPVREWD